MEEKEVKQENQNSVSQQVKSKNNKLIIILSAIIIVLIIGIVLYFVLGNKNKNDNNQKENNVSESIVYKTQDGKKVLKIISINDKDTLKKALNIDNNFEEISFKYFADYNGKLIGIESISNVGKYTIYDGDEIGKPFGQCGNAHFVCNSQDNTLLNFSYDLNNDGFEYEIYQMDDKYYFSENYCNLDLSDNGFYDEKLNKIGDYYFNKDNKNNFYVLLNNNFIKYNKDGEILKQNKEKYDTNKIISVDGSPNSFVYNDTMYIVYDNNILDTMSGELYKIDAPSNYDLWSVSLNNGKIELLFNTGEDKYNTYKFDLKSKKIEKEKDSSIPDKAVAYKNDDKEIYLLEIANDKKNTGVDSHTYELYEGANKIKVYSGYGKNKFIVSNDNNWYYLDKENKKIIAFYTSKNRVSYNSNGWEGDKQDWYIVYDVVGNKWNIVKVVNENKGAILTFTKDYPEKFIIKDEKVYLQFNNKIIKYDANGKTLDTKTYDKILYFSRERGDIDKDLVVIQNNNYYKVDLSNMKAELLQKEFTYTDNNQNVDFYLLQKRIDEYNPSVYMFEYKNQFYTTNLPFFGEKDSEYDNIYFDKIEGAGQNFAGSFLVNKKNNKIISYSDFASMTIIKTNNGYFFIEQGFSEGDNPYHDDVYIARKVITDKNNTIPGKGMCSVVENYLIIENNNKLIKYSIDGTIRNSMDIDNVILIERDNALVKIDNQYYVINLKTYEKKQIDLSNTIIEKDTTTIYAIDNEKIYYYDGDENKTYNY